MDDTMEVSTTNFNRLFGIQVAFCVGISKTHISYTLGDNINWVGNAVNISLAGLGDTTPWNKWHLVILRRSGSTTDLILNGVIIHSTPNWQTDVSLNKNHPFELSDSGNGSSQEFKGYMDQVRVFDRALTLDEIKILFRELIDRSKTQTPLYSGKGALTTPNTDPSFNLSLADNHIKTLTTSGVLTLSNPIIGQEWSNYH